MGFYKRVIKVQKMNWRVTKDGGYQGKSKVPKIQKYTNEHREEQKMEAALDKAASVFMMIEYV